MKFASLFFLSIALARFIRSQSLTCFLSLRLRQCLDPVHQVGQQLVSISDGYRVTLQAPPHLTHVDPGGMDEWMDA